MLASEKLKKAVVVSEEKSQESSRRRGRFSAASFLAGKCPNLGRDSRSCRKIGEELSSSVELLPENPGMPDSHSEFSEIWRAHAIQFLILLT